ncbi:alpha-amylase family glycosyl hydrolase [Sphingomonas sp. 28-62-20]|uniref:alpha-amylase family glycosyl hydrolase n=1 Tax=Sphingomonas sp. 28-62-20 TaxID=1970433 RepID=UPI0035A8CD65
MVGATVLALLLQPALTLPAFAQQSPAPAPAPAPSYRDRLPQDEIIYFLLPDRFENGDTSNDRGGLKGDRLVTGYDPTAKGFYHGGDLKGVTKRLDYIQALGATAIWVGPIFKNKPVQGAPGQESAGYHGYWITDFTQVDPHLGTNADFKALVDAAHSRGMKVYMDIIVNHTADVIKYRECVPDQNCAYRAKADYPFQRRGGLNGAAINPAFASDSVQTPENFAKLTDPSFAYTPYLPKGEEQAKTPDWLNDMTLYHNRGDSVWTGESVTYGDFSGLDDIATEHPRVVAGMIDIFGGWIDRFGVDGFRIDTAKHVNPEFWQAFVPAMLARATAKGIPHFHIFGEVATGDVDPALLARHTRVDKLPAVLDFAFARAVVDIVAGQAGTSEIARLFDDDALYDGGADAAQTLPTFLGNHDAGRFATFVRQLSPKADRAEQLARVKLGHAMLLTLRGVPTVYSGDEQGFVGDGGDQDAREDMFPSAVAIYNDNQLLGTSKTTADSNFDRDHPLFAFIAKLARLRSSQPALREGRTLARAASEKPGLLAVSRFDPVSGQELLIAFNSSTAPINANVEVANGSLNFTALYGQCAPRASAPGSVGVSVPALDFIVCAAEKSK